MMKVMIAGDTHGNFHHLLDLIDCARQNEVEYIIQLGDFGYWEHTYEGEIFLDELSKSLVRGNVTLDFLCGNHDNTPLLWKTYGNKHTRVRPNLWYRPRGGIWHVNDVPIMSLGGAFSIDAVWRRQIMKRGEPDCWWSEEELSDLDVNRAKLNGGIVPPYIMLTHDAPDGAPISELGSAKIDKTLQARSMENREKVRDVMNTVQPAFLFHGHFHTRLDYVIRTSSTHEVSCHSLGCDPEGQRMKGERVRSGNDLINRGLDLFEESYVIFEMELP